MKKSTSKMSRLIVLDEYGRLFRVLHFLMKVLRKHEKQYVNATKEMIQRITILILLLLPISFHAQDFKTKIVNEETYLVYPKYYDYENYQGFSKDSLPNGKWIAYFDDSVSVAFKGSFKNGLAEGPFEYFYKSGIKRYLCIYKAGQENGQFAYWDRSGNVEMTGSNINGLNEGPWFQWYKNGKLRSYYSFVNGNIDGVDYFYNPDGSINKECNYSNGYRVGEWKYYHDNGMLKEQMFFVDSLTAKEWKIIKKYENTVTNVTFPIGVWQTWDENGKLIKKTVFNNSYEIEQEIEYYPTGELKKEVNFKGFHQGFCSQDPSYFVKNGEIKEWYANGNLRVKGNNVQNEKTGKWTFWQEDGNILKEEFYQNGDLIE